MLVRILKMIVTSDFLTALQCTILYSLSLTKNKVVFFRIASAAIMFVSLGQTDGHRCHDSTLPKTSWWIENCTKFGQFILSKIIKIVATRGTSGPILRLKCTIINFGTSWGAYSAPQTSLAALKLKGAYM